MTDNNNNFNKDSEDDLLRKVDIIRERTGVSYRQAKDALDKNGGSLLQTLIYLEEIEKSSFCENGDGDRVSWTEEFTVRSTEVINKVKDLIRQGNITKIRIKHENKVLADIPVSLGAIGAVVLPQLAALGVLVAVFKQCTIEVIRTEDNYSETESTLRNDEKEETKIKNDPF